MDFGSYFWLLIWWFVFFMYLMVLFHIIGDLFKDDELSGWWKAVWIVVLIVLPYLGALIYLIARGKGMGERQMQSAQETKAATDEYIRSVSQKTSPAEEIASAKALLDSGAITQAEFDQLKARSLA